MHKKLGRETRTAIIACPAEKNTRDRYYNVAGKLNKLREKGKANGGWVPKKLTQIHRETIEDMLDKVEAEMSKRRDQV